jgi:hypothetical protein
MKPSARTSDNHLRNIGALFDESERKQLFRKYLLFLGWIELLILVVCVLYQLGDQGYDQSGPIPIPFPWKAYFAVSFLAPVAISFLVGMVIAGFNRYFGDHDAEQQPVDGRQEASASGAPAGRMQKIQDWVGWMQRLPFLTLLLLLASAVAIFLKMDAILTFVASVGEKSAKVILISVAVLLGVGSLFALLLIVMNYKLRKSSMEYQYKSEMGTRFGIIILEDNTVLNREGKLLLPGKKWKDMAPQLPVLPAERSYPETHPNLPPRAADLDT